MEKNTPSLRCHIYETFPEPKTTEKHFISPCRPNFSSPATPLDTQSSTFYSPPNSPIPISTFYNPPGAPTSPTSPCSSYTSNTLRITQRQSDAARTVERHLTTLSSFSIPNFSLYETTTPYHPTLALASNLNLNLNLTNKTLKTAQAAYERMSIATGCTIAEEPWACAWVLAQVGEMKMRAFMLEVRELQDETTDSNPGLAQVSLLKRAVDGLEEAWSDYYQCMQRCE